MSDSADIIVKSYFSQQNHPGYGSTPGSYVADYVTRDEAAEAYNPELIEDTPTLSAKARPIESGRVFGSEGLIYNSEQALHGSEKTQEHYDTGGTVQRMVVSFRDDWTLQRLGILPKGIRHRDRGDYRQNIDELKLRSMVSAGMDRLAEVGHYQYPYWLASVHVNTDHVHVHIVMFDQQKYGERTRKADEEQRGMLWKREKEAFRQGLIDRSIQMQKLSPSLLGMQLKQQEHFQVQDLDRAQMHRMEHKPEYQHYVRYERQRLSVEKQREFLADYHQRFLESARVADTIAPLYTEAESSTKMQDNFVKTELNYQMARVDRYRRYFGNPPISSAKLNENLQNSQRYQAWRNGNLNRQDYFKSAVIENEPTQMVLYRPEKAVDYHLDVSDDSKTPVEMINPDEIDFAVGVQKKRLKAGQQVLKEFGNKQLTDLDPNDQAMMLLASGSVNDAKHALSILSEANEETVDTQEEITYENSYEHEEQHENKNFDRER